MSYEMMVHYYHLEIIESEEYKLVLELFLYNEITIRQSAFYKSFQLPVVG